MPALWTSGAVAQATGGRVIEAFEAHGVAFDSREVTGGELFVALKGASDDGHRHWPAARAAGASGVLASAPVEGPCVLVEDTGAALAALGRAGRVRAADATILGVTGSVGKTGVKEALARALDQQAPGRTHWSVRSYNNHTGVPLSLARMPADTRFGVFEMGMNHAGEIAALTRLVRPHVAVVTWVAAAHVGNFADGEAGVARAKAEVFGGLVPGGAAVIPADNAHAPTLLDSARSHAARVLTFGAGAGCDVRLVDARKDWDASWLKVDCAGEHLSFRLGVPGDHWVSNALCVLAAVHAAGADVGQAALALGAMVGLDGRGARRPVPVPGGGEAILVDESYNANPASMAAALALVARAPGRRLAVLGEMGELGADSARHHAALGPAIRAAGLAEVALVGPAMETVDVEGAARLADADAAVAWVRAHLRDGDILLVKGSNAVGLGGIVAALGEVRR